MRVPAPSTTSMVLSAGSSASVNHTCSSVGVADAVTAPPTAGLARLTRACAATSLATADTAARASSATRSDLLFAGCMKLHRSFGKLGVTLRRVLSGRKEPAGQDRTCGPPPCATLDHVQAGDEDRNGCASRATS